MWEIGQNLLKIVIIVGDSIFDVVDEIKLCVENEIPLIRVSSSAIWD
jgi:hypothetical protein